MFPYVICSLCCAHCKKVFRITFWLGRVNLPQTIHTLNGLETGIDYIQTKLISILLLSFQ